MKKSDIFWQTYLSLEREAIEVSRYIFITDERIENVKGEEIRKHDETQLNVYSPRIADLLIRCCVQIEAISKSYTMTMEVKRREVITLYSLMKTALN